MTTPKAALESALARWIKPLVRTISAYPVPDSTGMIKLDAMENPYLWPEHLTEQWLARLREVSVNRYPDPRASTLLERVRRHAQVPEGQSIMLGNGSDELIQILLLALAQPGQCVLAPEPGFVMYRMIAGFTGLEYVGVPLREDFSLDMSAMLAAIERHQPAVMFIAYPNNPTGNCFARADIERLLEVAPGLVVLDEAYAPFARDSFMADLPAHPQLLVMRTVSKQGLAGLRLGYLCGDPAWISEFDKVRLPYNINVLTQISVSFALEHQDVFAAQAQAICRDREQVFAALSAMPGITPFPSEANFILLRTPSGQATSIFNALRERQILIKNLAPAGGLLDNCLRVTIGTPDENRAFLAALADCL